MASGDQSNYFVHPLLRARDWQHRPQLDDVCAWWRGGGPGVCALVGMGGAGKTAIAERFLRILPGGLPQDPDVAKDDSLPRPHSTFVFSFYDAPNPEAFFEALQIWLEQTPRVETVLSVGQLLYLLQQTPGLVVLDGLEKVQDDGSRGVFGRLTSPKLRDFLDQLAAGFVPDISVLVTSRFPLADLRDARPQFFRKIAIEEIDVATGVKLLKDRGVIGNDSQLAPIVEECGQHALTVDFAGGYIKEFGNGDHTTPLHLGTAEELQAEAEQEPDDERRAVLKQGIRFARIAERYRDAMLNSDEAAIALLERICLFRLGVDSQTLAAIFTGPDAAKVSGKALANLDADQLQKKLNWLVRLRIVEVGPVSQPAPRYTIHPAVRDGFFSGIGRADRQASHEAVRKGLEVSLGDAPGENPSDPATLDLLEEIVHHTLQSGHVPEAWDIYENRIGNFQNLGHRLGVYERGERICRAFAAGESPQYVAEFARIRDSDQDDRILASRATKDELPYLSLTEDQQAVFINEWALYLHQLGRLPAAVRCYELLIEFDRSGEEWKQASRTIQNLCDCSLLSGRLRGTAGKGSLSIGAEALRLAELARDTLERQDSHAFRAQARALRGEVPAALADFLAALDLQHEIDGDDDPLYTRRGVLHSHLLARLGRHEEATRVTEANREICHKHWGENDHFTPQCNLMLSDLLGESLDRSTRESLCRSARDWASQRGAKEVLCWSALVQARLELAIADCRLPNDAHASAAETAITEGLKIARDCGFGLYHIDLLLEAARLHLLRGNPQSALDDLRLALDDGIPADDQTGQPELLAANHEACGYAWAIPAGLQLRAEAQLLQAAQMLGEATYKPRSRKTPAEARELIKQAKSNLRKAMTRWKKLHDPEPERPDQNFQLDGKPYNYRAADTHQLLVQLEGGILTRYPLAIPTATASQQEPTDKEQTMAIDEQRIKDLEGHVKKDATLLNEYEDELRYEDDPKRRARHRREIERLRESMKEYRSQLELMKPTGAADSPRVDGLLETVNDMNVKMDRLLKETADLRAELLGRFSRTETVIIESVVSRLSRDLIEDTNQILQALESGRVSDTETNEMLELIGSEIATLKSQLPENIEGDVVRVLVKAEEVLADPRLSVKHKLKTGFPIIPFILSYEAEVELGQNANLISPSSTVTAGSRFFRLFLD